MVAERAANRNALAETAVKNQLESAPPGFVFPSRSGFIANRIGGYWMMRGLEEAVRQGVSVEQADTAMGVAAGIPKTGIFGLFDVVGIDLMSHTAATIAASAALPADDPLRKLDPQKTLALVGRMIEDGYMGTQGQRRILSADH